MKPAMFISTAIYVGNTIPAITHTAEIGIGTMTFAM